MMDVYDPPRPARINDPAEQEAVNNEKAYCAAWFPRALATARTYACTREPGHAVIPHDVRCDHVAGDIAGKIHARWEASL